MNNDLISREDLKKVFGYTDEWYKGRTVCAIIDNAPTVKPDMALLLAYESGKASNERPTGAWINHRNDYGHNIADCSRCGKAMQWHDDDEDGIPRFCWYCGTKMKNGEEE